MRARQETSLVRPRLRREPLVSCRGRRVLSIAPLPHLPLHNGLSSVSNDLTTGTDQRSASFWAAVSKTDKEAVL